MNRKIFVSVIAFLAGFIIFYSCTKIDTTDLGNELIPAVDNVTTFDTVFDIITDNRVLNDTTRYYDRQPIAIGLIENDPEFGKTDAAVYFSLGPASYGSYPFIHKDSVKAIDSVVLQVVYSSLWGDSLSQENFDVFQIDPNAAFSDSSYRVSEPGFTVLPAVLGSKTVNFQTLNDSLTYVNGKDTVKTINQLRIRLDTNFAKQFVNFDTTQYKTDSSFFSNFKGLAVKVNAGTSPLKNALGYFDVTNASTQLVFYMRLQSGGKIDTTTRSFAYTGRQANTVHRTPSGNYATYLANGPGNDDLLYLQPSPGSYIEVKIPGLENLTNRIIHRAELVFEQIPSALDNIYTPPSLLFVDGINATGDSVFTLRNDFVYSNSSLGYEVGILRGDFQNNKYAFNISRYVQSIITKKLPSRTLRVYAPYVTDPWYESGTGSLGVLPTLLFINSPIAKGRVVLGGGSHPAKKARLRIIYSKI